MRRVALAAILASLAAPAFAGPGLQLQGVNLNGINLNGTVAGALITAPTGLTLPAGERADAR